MSDEDVRVEELEAGAGEQPSEDEYTSYLKSKGIDPGDLPKVVEAIKTREDRLNEVTQRLQHVEYTANQLAQRQVQAPQAPDEDRVAKSWEEWAKHDPSERVQSIIEQKLASTRMADALDDMAASYLEKENGPELFEMLKPIAAQLVQNNPGHYAGPPKSSIRRVFKDAEEYFKKNMKLMASLGGFTVNEGSQRTNAAIGAAAAGALGGANRQPLRQSNKENEESVLKRYNKALEQGDTNTMLELSLKHDWLATKRPSNPWEG